MSLLGLTFLAGFAVAHGGTTATLLSAGGICMHQAACAVYSSPIAGHIVATLLFTVPFPDSIGVVIAIGSSEFVRRRKGPLTSLQVHYFILFFPFFVFLCVCVFCHWTTDQLN